MDVKKILTETNCVHFVDHMLYLGLMRREMDGVLNVLIGIAISVP